MSPPPTLLGVLRHSSRRPPSLFAPILFRSFSRIPPSTFSPILLRTSIIRSPSRILALAPCTHRSISLKSIFSMGTPQPTPSPIAVAHISRLEGEANAHPTDVDKQLQLFFALVDTKTQAGRDLIMARWERMCEFDPSSPLLHSDKAFEYYLKALVDSKLEPSVDPAVRRRESLLAAHPLGATTATATPSPAESTSPASESSPASPSTVSQLSASQLIAQQVRSGETSPTSSAFTGTGGQPLSPDMAKFAAAIGTGAGLSSNPIHVQVSEPKNAWVPKVVRTVLFTGVGVFFILSFLAVMVENTGLLRTPSRPAEFEPEKSTKPVKFSDVHGVDEAKEELKDVVEFLKDPSAFAELGGRLPKGVLLTGQPGTGKTMLARAVAGEAGVPFLFASGSEFEEMFVGVGAKRVRELFAAARDKQPAIIFIDELDAIGGKRSAKDQNYMKQTLNQLLVEMDGFQQDEGVIVIAATNFPESLDDALVRPGRFDRHIAVPLPDIRGRTQILQHHMMGVKTSKEVDLMRLARGTAGFSGADLQNMVNQAAVQASKERCKEVSLSHFEWARDRILMGAERKSMFVDDKEKKLTAYHEGGHALTALYTEGATPLHKVTCMPRGHALGITSFLPESDRLSITYKQFLAEIDVAMGGRVAEELIFGRDNVTSGCSSDLRKATSVATQMVRNYGYSEKLGPVWLGRDDPISPKNREEVENEVRSMLKAGSSRVFALLKSKEKELHLLADALVEHETLDMEEVKKVIRGEPIRNIKDVIQEDLSHISPPDIDGPSASVKATAAVSS